MLMMIAMMMMMMTMIYVDDDKWSVSRYQRQLKSMIFVVMTTMAMILKWFSGNRSRIDRFMC